MQSCLAHADVISMKSGMGHLVIFYPHSIEHIVACHLPRGFKLRWREDILILLNFQPFL